MIYVMCGIPGSGKSHYVKIKKEFLESINHRVYVLNATDIRTLFTNNYSDKRFYKQVFSTINYWLVAYLRRCTLKDDVLIDKITGNEVDIFIDATYIKREHRTPLVKIAQDAGMGNQIACVFVNPPIDIVLKQNKEREFIVPERRILQMHEQFEFPSEKEGFAKIYVIE